METFLQNTAEFARNAAGRIYGVAPESLQGEHQLSAIVGGLMKSILALLGVVFAVLVIYGALSWMLSRGEEEKIEAARKLITNATIGLALAVAGYTLTVLIVDVILRTAINQPILQ